MGYITIEGKKRDAFSSSFKEIEKISKKVKTNSCPVLTSVLSSPKQLRPVPSGMSVSKELSMLINAETERFYVKTCQGKIRPDVEADIESQKARVGRFKVSPLFNEKDSASLEESDKYLSAAQEYVVATFSGSDSLTRKAGILAIDMVSIATVAQLLFSLWDTLFSHWGTTKSSAATLGDYAVVAFVVLLFLVFLFVLNWPRKKKNN